MEQLFNFFTRYICDDGEIFNLSTNTVVCKDQYISILELPDNISSVLLSRGVDKLSKLIMVGNAFLQFCDFSSSDINLLYEVLNDYLEGKQTTLIEDVIEDKYLDLDFDESDEILFSDEIELPSYVEEELEDDSQMLSNVEEQISETPLEVLNLSVRSINCLKRAGIMYVEELKNISIEKLYSIRNLGAKSAKEIIMKRDTFFSVPEYETKKTVEINIDELCDFYQHVTINSLDLSVRSLNCLKNSNVVYLTDLFRMEPSAIRNIKSLGSKSYKEILNIIEEYKCKFMDYSNSGETDEQVNSDDLAKYFLVPEMIKIEDNVIYLLVKKAYVFDIKLSELSLAVPVVSFLNDNNYFQLSDLLIKGLDKLLENKGFGKSKKAYLTNELEKYIRNNIVTFDDKESLKLALENKISLYVKGFGFDGVNRTKTIEYFSNIFEKEDVLLTLESLITNRVLFIYEDDKLFYRYESFPAFLYRIKQELPMASRIPDIMFSKIDGETLEAIGQRHGVTRELIRQQIAKFFNKYVVNKDTVINTFKEDKYSYIFQKYSFSKSDFTEIFSEKERTYNYLTIRYKHGNEELIKALDDTVIPKRIRACIQKFLDKDFIFIEGNRLPKERKNILAYYISKNVFKQTHLLDIVSGFNEFVREYDETLQLVGTDHSIEGHVSRVPNIVCSLHKLYRYYDFDAYDWERFLEEINLEGYDGLNIYSTLLFRKHPKLMEKYNILDQYELHNILRQLYEKKDSNVDFRKMPNIFIGKFNRIEYMLSVLEEFGELSTGEFASILDERLGIETQASFWISELKEYHEFGKYVYHAGDADYSELSRVLSSLLTEDFYFKYEVENILKKEQVENNGEIPGRVFNELGYIVNSSYIVKKPHNAKSFFKEVLTEKDIFDHDLIKKYSYLQIFSETFTELRSSYDVIQFSEQSFINFRKLQAFGISKQDLVDYCESAIAFADSDYFTIKSLENIGFYSELEDLGFDNIFYESLLKYCPKISFFRTNNVYVFKFTNDSISKTTFISNIIDKYKFIESCDLIDLLKNNYGIKVDIYELKEAISNTNIYYNSIMDTFYINYNVFLEEV